MDMQLPHAVSKLAHARAERRHHPRIDLLCSQQLSASFASHEHAVWLRMHPAPRPSFNRDLLRDLGTYCSLLERSGGRWPGTESTDHDIDFVILASAVPGVFNFGGDLALFMQLIENQDQRALLEYGQACVEVLYRNHVGHSIRATTISLVQGECLGGGFEAALSSDVVIAERSSRFGFPEILFNLFPGMGAYSFLERRVGRVVTEELLNSGKVFTADDMLHRGIVDVVCADGEGEAAVRDWMDGARRCRNGRLGIARARRRVCGVSRDELLDVVGIWVDTAMHLGPRDLKLMQRLVSRQNSVAHPETMH